MTDDNRLDENDLPNETIEAMWDEAEPIEFASGPSAPWLSGWSARGCSDIEPARATVSYERTHREVTAWISPREGEERSEALRPEHRPDSNLTLGV